MQLNNLFEQERLSAEIPLPSLFGQIGELETVFGEGEKEDPEITPLFPHTSNQPVIHFRKGKKQKENPLRVGVLFSGGQAAGGHNVILGLLDALQKFSKKSILVGFLGGPAGLIDNQFRELGVAYVSQFRNTGGFDMIGSGRTKIETKEQLHAALKSCVHHQLDGLVIIGGDDSNTNAALLAEFFKAEKCSTKVIGVPKTIDGDLKNRFVESSFGFDTACKVYSEMIGNICRDALSAKKYSHFIRLMGRSASHITLECALQTQPNMALIAEEIAAKQMTLKDITEKICTMLEARARSGKHYSVILIPEGLIEFIPEMKQLILELNQHMAEDPKNVMNKLSAPSLAAFKYLPKEIGEQLLLDRDPHGNVQLSHIATEQLLIHTVKNAYQGKFHPVGHFFGYEGRCGYPTLFDASYCYALGFTAASLIRAGASGYMSVVRHLAKPVEAWEPCGFPLTVMMNLEMRKGKNKPVIKKALVELEGEPFQYFKTKREEWASDDHYRFVGPIQYSGPSASLPNFTLLLSEESN